MPSAGVTGPSRIAVVGAGAIGSLVAGRMAAAGLDVTLLARGARLKRLEGQDLCIEAPEGQVAVRVPVAAELAEAGFDLVVSAVKAQALAGLAPAIAAALAPQGVFLPLVNGMPWWYFHDGRDNPDVLEAVDPDGVVAQHLAARSVTGSVVFARAALDGNGNVLSQGGERFTLGAIRARDADGTAKALRAMTEAGFAVSGSEAIRRDVWVKLALNLATNPLSVVSGATLEEMARDPHLRDLVAQSLRETLTLAQALGQGPFPEVAQLLDICAEAGPFMTSMAQDYGKHRPLELASIADATFEVADGQGVAMPTSRAVAGLAAYLSRRQRAADV